MSPGKRESHWLVVRRCLAIIRRAQRGRAGREDLIKAMLAEESPGDIGSPDCIEEVEKSALFRRLENDLRRIRRNLLVDVNFDRQAGGYMIRDCWTPLLDLPDRDLATIAWLEETFDLRSPQHDEVHSLLGKLRLYLGPERLAVIERSRTALALDLSQRDEDEILPAVQEKLTKALLQRRQIEFLYLSPQYEDGQPRRHVADPHERYFDTTRGHYYLYAYCRRCEGPEGHEELNCFITYRIGRISALKVLPRKLSPVSPAAPCYQVAYELKPEIARTGTSRPRWIEVETVDHREDGSALVRGKTSNLFWAVRSLLHYGPNCRVIGGPEMAQEMREIVRKMVEMYVENW